MTEPSATGPTRMVVKLGGSVITRKREVERLRPKILARLAGELTHAEPGRLVLLHGAGSFGHPGAHRFGLARAPEAGEDARRRSRGAAIVAAEVRRLHLAVLRALLDAGAAPVSVPMATHARNRAGRLAALETLPFETVLARGGLPVSFGDVVPDEEWGWSILSADAIAESLVPALGIRRVLFVSDVPGILEGPASGRRRVVANVTDEVVRTLRPVSGGPDVTGGVRSKAAAMCAIARAGADAGLISGLSDGTLRRAVQGEFVYGSWARASTG